MRRIETRTLTIFAALALCAACSDDDDDPGADPGQDDSLEIEGRYTSNFDDAEGNPIEETITSTSWNQGFTALDLVEFDNTENVVYASGPKFEEPETTVFSKIVWTEPEADGSFYYCTVDFNAESLAAAKASTTMADESDPGQGGCFGFPWTRNTPLP